MVCKNSTRPKLNCLNRHPGGDEPSWEALGPSFWARKIGIFQERISDILMNFRALTNINSFCLFFLGVIFLRILPMGFITIFHQHLVGVCLQA